MKRHALYGLAILMVVFIVGVVTAQEKKDTAKGAAAAGKRVVREKISDDARVMRPDPRRVPPKNAQNTATPARPEATRAIILQRQLQSLKAQIDQRKQTFQTYAVELMEIKKLATAEGAKKTIAYVDKVLADRQKQTDTEIESFQERIKQLEDQSSKQPKPAEPANDNPAPKQPTTPVKETKK